jgi:carboxyl-terminal processing protease
LAEGSAALGDTCGAKRGGQCRRRSPAGPTIRATKRYKNQLARLDQTRAEDIFRAYINTFAMSYDPHTNYLSPDNAENFDINMSLSLEASARCCRATTTRSIVRLVPAGPAADNRLAPADKIIGVAARQQRDGRRGRLAPGRSGQADPRPERHRGAPGSDPASNAPNDQTSKIVPITREAVKLEDQAVKKSVLNLKQDGKDYKLGVIEIPAFYLTSRPSAPAIRTTRAPPGREEAADRAAERKVDGVVIDLRNNGGGSCRKPPS